MNFKCKMNKLLILFLPGLGAKVRKKLENAMLGHSEL